ncbi:MAG: hypothetical protein ACKVOB_13210 [Sphingomonas sp.]
MSDPSGELLIEFADERVICHYQFGLMTADFLICSTCGVYLAALDYNAETLIGVLNARTLDRFGEFGMPQAVSFEGEDATERSARRLARWTPTVIHGRVAEASASSPRHQEQVL